MKDRKKKEEVTKIMVGLFNPPRFILYVDITSYIYSLGLLPLNVVQFFYISEADRMIRRIIKSRWDLSSGLNCF